MAAALSAAQSMDKSAKLDYKMVPVPTASSKDVNRALVQQKRSSK